MHWRGSCWGRSSNIMAIWCEVSTRWKRLWCCKRLEQKKGMIEDQMLGWHHRSSGFEFEQACGRWWRARRHDILQSRGLWRVGDDWVTEQQIRASNNKSTECIWPWVVSGAIEACHIYETQDSGKTLNVFDLELVKQPLICATALKQWMSISYMVYLLWNKWRTTWNTICSHFKWSAFDLV